jgi:hypothetical protein
LKENSSSGSGIFLLVKEILSTTEAHTGSLDHRWQYIKPLITELDDIGAGISIAQGDPERLYQAVCIIMFALLTWLMKACSLSVLNQRITDPTRLALAGELFGVVRNTIIVGGISAYQEGFEKAPLEAFVQASRSAIGSLPTIAAAGAAADKKLPLAVVAVLAAEISAILAAIAVTNREVPEGLIVAAIAGAGVAGVAAAIAGAPAADETLAAGSSAAEDISVDEFIAEHGADGTLAGGDIAARPPADETPAGGDNLICFPEQEQDTDAPSERSAEAPAADETLAGGDIAERGYDSNSEASEAPPQLSAANVQSILDYLIKLEESYRQLDDGSDLDLPVESERPLLFYLNDIKSCIKNPENRRDFEGVLSKILNNDGIFSSTEKTMFNYNRRALAFALSKKYPEFSLKATNGTPVSNLNTALHQNDLTVTYSASPNTDAGR